LALSRYRNVNNIAEDSGREFYETSRFPSRAELDNIPTFKIRASNFERLDNLAFKHLGSGEYWWIIALINDIDWMYSFEEGKILKIPLNAQDVLKLF